MLYIALVALLAVAILMIIFLTKKRLSSTERDEAYNRSISRLSTGNRCSEDKAINSSSPASNIGGFTALDVEEKWGTSWSDTNTSGGTDGYSQ